MLASAAPGSATTSTTSSVAADGRTRLPDAIRAHSPEVLLLMEGANELNFFGRAGVTRTVSMRIERASISNSRPTAGVANPPASLSASAACIVPTMPVSGANTPIVAQRTSSTSSPSGNRRP